MWCLNRCGGVLFLTRLRLCRAIVQRSLQPRGEHPEGGSRHCHVVRLTGGLVEPGFISLGVWGYTTWRISRVSPSPSWDLYQRVTAKPVAATTATTTTVKRVMLV